MTSLHSLLTKVSLLWVSRLKADHWACAVSPFASWFAGQCRLPVDLHPRSKQTDIWLVQFCAWSSAKVTNVSASWHLENKLWQVRFWPLPFVHAEAWSSATRAAILKRWTLLTILSVSKRNGPQPLPPILNRLRLETNYELLIWSLSAAIQFQN